MPNRTQKSMSKAANVLEKIGWKLKAGGNNGIIHPKYGNLSFTIKGFEHCCGADEVGGFYFEIRDKAQCQKALNAFFTAYGNSMLLATVVKHQKPVRELLVKVGFKPLKELQFRNKNSKRIVETLYKKDDPSSNLGNLYSF